MIVDLKVYKSDLLRRIRNRMRRSILNLTLRLLQDEPDALIVAWIEGKDGRLSVDYAYTEDSNYLECIALANFAVEQIPIIQKKDT